MARVRAGLTVTQLAKALRVARPTVSMWERGRRGVGRHYWPALTVALGLSEEDLTALFARCPPSRLDAVRLPSLARFRRSAGLTQAALAQRVGVAPTTLAMWESSGVRVQLAVVAQLCAVLGVELGELTANSPVAAPDPRPLRRYRKAVGMSRAEAAAQLGISVGALARYEAGERRTPIPVVRRMAPAYGRRVGELLPHSGSTLLPLPPGRLWFPEELPDAVRALRIAAGLTKVGLGRAVGRSGQAVAAWEAGRARPSPATCRRLEVVFGLVPGRLPY
ncbi:helix-turn-helix domain-containing protein [Geodermatophilus sp. CPCC 205506]|uniref:helix-turn-helix domain-containing protein n=1 Tax=Geodermatophilus sp. CPCC 205506 TaxID=2936596 RepID=UPI003F52988D